MITELKYSRTNTYYITGRKGALLFDTDWAGTFPLLCRKLGECGLRLQDIDLLLISHFHPDHSGIAQQIADTGVQLVVADVQLPFVHSSDHIFEKENNRDFVPVDDKKLKVVPVSGSRAFLKEAGFDGELFYTPGHSDDSISLWLDKERALFVGDLNPLYELEMHKGTAVAQSWERLLMQKPRRVYYGHAKPAELSRSLFGRQQQTETDVYALVKRIMRLIDKGCSAEEIQEKTGADAVFVRDVARMYLTHQNVSVQGILDRIEIKGR